MKRSRFIVAALVLSLVVGIFSGCATKTGSTEGAEVAKGGNLILRVNPEISIEYDKEGRVTKIEGLNEDGNEIIADYKDNIGKDCKVVVKELIEKIHEQGYFVADAEGKYRNITLQIEPGSSLPNEKFLDEIVYDVRETIQSLQLESSIVGIDNDDYDDRYTGEGKPSAYIDIDKAKEFALPIQASPKTMLYLRKRVRL